MRLALDFANYTPVPTQEQVRCWIAEGYTTAIVGVSFGSVARAQLEACADGGMDIEAFCWVRFNDVWKPPLDRALEAIDGLPVKRLWLDCEDATRWKEAEIALRINEAEVYLTQRTEAETKAIYTGAWWWNQYMPTNKTFASWDLWTANYVSNARKPPEGQPPLYGGWTEAAIWQYVGTVETCGLNTDRNVMLEEDELASKEYDELYQRDEDLKVVIARVDAAVKYLIEVTVGLAAKVEALEKK